MAGTATCHDCCGCLVATDDFNRADAPTLGPAWLSGPARIESNEAVMDDPAGTHIYGTAHPGGASANVFVEVEIKRAQNDDQAGVILAIDQTSGQYLIAAIQTTLGCAELFLEWFDGAASGLVSIQGLPVSDVGEWTTIRACWSPADYPEPGILRAKVTMASGRVFGQQLEIPDASGLGAFAGIYGITGGDSEARFDNWKFGYARDDTPDKKRCPDCGGFPCLIDSDDFPGGSETPCKWESDRLRTGDPTGATEHCVTASFTIASGESATVKVNMKSDGSDYLFATLSRSGDDLTLAIGRGGTTSVSDTITLTSPPAELSASLCVCAIDGDIYACANGTSLFLQSDEGAPVADGVFAGRSGTVDWTGFVFERLDNKCPPCECADNGVSTNCCGPPELSLVHPEFFLITISGITRGENDVGLPPDGCSVCDNWNGAQLLKRSNAACDPLANTFECWRWNGTSTVCGTAEYSVLICDDPPPPAEGPYPTSGYIVYQAGRASLNDKHCTTNPPAEYLVFGGVTQGGVASFWRYVPHALQPIDFTGLRVPIGDIYKNSSDPAKSLCYGGGAVLEITAINK